MLARGLPLLLPPHFSVLTTIRSRLLHPVASISTFPLALRLHIPNHTARCRHKEQFSTKSAAVLSLLYVSHGEQTTPLTPCSPQRQPPDAQRELIESSARASRIAPAQ